jgi:hypothetical protein
VSTILTLENAARQKKTAQNRALAVDLSSRLAIRCDEFGPDIAFPALCAVFAQQIKKRVHSTNFMNAIGQMAQEIHRMVFDPETAAQAQEVKEEVRAELNELTVNANRWIVFLQEFRNDIRFGPYIQGLQSEVDDVIKELEEAAKRVSEA